MTLCFIEPQNAIRVMAESVGREARRQILGEVVRAWVDDENVNVALFHEGTLGRSAQIRGPERLGPGRYVLYQDVTWADDGSVTSAPFYSGYYW